MSVSGCSKSTIATPVTGIPSNNLPTHTKDSPTVPTESEKDKSRYADVDYIDLTIVNSTILNVEVYNMLAKPNDYIGKTIKIDGPYCNEYDKNTDKYYHFLLYDRCCQVIEIMLEEQTLYPEIMSEIVVTGVFGTYMEYGQSYCCLYVDELEVLAEPNS
jgi:hypothetical protein